MQCKKISQTFLTELDGCCFTNIEKTFQTSYDEGKINVFNLMAVTVQRMKSNPR